MSLRNAEAGAVYVAASQQARKTRNEGRFAIIRGSKLGGADLARIG
jgi:hypothetical protein